MRKLDFLVPMYNETEEIIKPLLDSIAIQQNVNLKDDVGVIVCCDGGTARLSKKFMEQYPFEIEFYVCDHRGVSATRNACLDKSTAEYVAFADCDDMMFNACGLWVVFRDLEANDVDTFVSNFLEETRTADTDKVVYLVHSEDATFVHGKVHRRQYLIDQNIRWNEALTVHEDSYFNILCQSLTEKKYDCPTAFYLWKYRKESVCRHDPKYMLKTYHNLLKSSDALIQEFNRRGEEKKAKFYVVAAVMDAYYTMNKPDWINQDNKDYRDSTERNFAEYFRKYEDVWDSVADRDKMRVSNHIRERSVNEGMGMECVTISDWLNHIKEL